jgi:hypothetical protein
MSSFATRPTRQRAVVALTAALLVLGAQVVLQLLSTLLSTAVFGLSAPGDFLLSYAFPSYLFSVALGWLPFVVGVFLVLWLLAPIASGLRLGQVLVRSLLAVAGGTVIVFGAYLGTGLFSQISSSEGMVFGWASAIVGSLVAGMDSAFGYALYNALSNAISLVPLTVLAGVLVWVWPRARSVEHADAEVGAEV